jgi:hypothetical protein
MVGVGHLWLSGVRRCAALGKRGQFITDNRLGVGLAAQLRNRRAVLRFNFLLHSQGPLFTNQLALLVVMRGTLLALQVDLRLTLPPDDAKDLLVGQRLADLRVFLPELRDLLLLLGFAELVFFRMSSTKRWRLSRLL